MSDCSHSQHCYQRTFIVVIAFAFIFCVGFALMFKFIIDRQNTLIKEVSTLSNRLDTAAIEKNKGLESVIVPDDSVILPKKLNISEHVLNQLQWERVTLDSYGVQFFYPQGYIISGTGQWMSLYPVSTKINPSPIPVMNIRVLDNPKRLSLEQIIYENFDRSVIDMIQPGEVNGLNMREVTFKEVSDEFGTCHHFLVGLGDKVFDMFLYECLEWSHFQEVVQTFMEV